MPKTTKTTKITKTAKTTVAKYAIIQLLGKQHKISIGDTLVVDRLPQEEGKTLEIKEVLLVAEGDDFKIGQPLVEGASVVFKVMTHSKGEKIRVATYKAKSRSRKVRGHRQYQSTLEVTAIK